jgi:hypothetical protein
MSLGKLLKRIAPIAISAFAGPAIGASFGASPFVSRALTGALTSKLMGGRSKDALRNALLAGVSGAAFDKFGAAGDAATGGNQAIVRGGASTPPPTNPDIANRMGQTVPTEAATKCIAEAFKPKTFSAELLKSAGVGGDNLFARLLNTPMGEGLSAGLLMQLLSGDDEDEDTRTAFEKRPFGAGGPGGRLGGITFAKQGGEMGFPRRNGGIDPSEGSGTKDDVPAMLMAGEFVLTKDAVKGLGDGNQRKGIQRAYNMMDNLEARA